MDIYEIDAGGIDLREGVNHAGVLARGTTSCMTQISLGGTTQVLTSGGNGGALVLHGLRADGTA